VGNAGKVNEDNNPDGTNNDEGSTSVMDKTKRCLPQTKEKSYESVQVETVSDNKNAVANLTDAIEKGDPKTKTADKEAGTNNTSKKGKRRVRGMNIRMMTSTRTIKLIR
jgi:hypothetical protein